jgi:hypothetical protein
MVFRAVLAVVGTERGKSEIRAIQAQNQSNGHPGGIPDKWSVKTGFACSSPVSADNAGANVKKYGTLP